MWVWIITLCTLKVLPTTVTIMFRCQLKFTDYLALLIPLRFVNQHIILVVLFAHKLSGFRPCTCEPMLNTIFVFYFP